LSRTFLTRSEAETIEIGRQLAATLRPGSTVLLHGDLGSGKTVFVRGLAAGLGIDADNVTSPTFVILQEYRGRLNLFHADLYRLEGQRAIEDLGLEELAVDGVLAVEWAERLPRIPEGAVNVRIEDAGEGGRSVTIW
jgi:tRNA threonylcarbamoyladenosine biosynthesis protein TsaE